MSDNNKSNESLPCCYKSIHEGKGENVPCSQNLQHIIPSTSRVEQTKQVSVYNHDQVSSDNTSSSESDSESTEKFEYGPVLTKVLNEKKMVSYHNRS